MSSERLPDNQALAQAFDHEICSATGEAIKFGSLFYDCDVYPAEKRILVVFIRHFFCGNCQEYVRRLSSQDSPLHPSHRPNDATSATNFSKPVNRTLPTVVIIGPGQPSLIPSYKSLTQCHFDIYADPSTQLYDILGMQRTLSMGSKSPGYIEHSLVSGSFKSAWQIVRRVGSGDAMAGGNWDINGGEFLFTRAAMTSRSESRSPSRSRSRSISASSRASKNTSWEVSWCHRMLNSRDHTELKDLAYYTCFTTCSEKVDHGSRTDSPASPLKSILVNSRKASCTSLSRGYASERLGSCPAPDIPKPRAEILPRSRTHSSSNSVPRSRSRSTSTSSRTAKQNHDRVWSNMSSTDISPPEPISIAPSGIVNSLSEAEKEEIRPRKSFSASLVEVLGVRTALLKRSKSISGQAGNGEESEARPRVPRSITDLGTASRAGEGSSVHVAQVRTKSPSTMTLLRTKSRSKRQDIPKNEQLPSHHSVPDRPSSRPSNHTRSRTFSFSKSSPSSKNKPSSPHHSRQSSSGNVEMAHDSVMLVDGVEFVNVISVKASVENTRLEEEQRRRHIRERADSGLGMGVAETAASGSSPSVPERLSTKKNPIVTALPEIESVC